MDRRKIKRQGLHKNLNPLSMSQASAESEDVFSSANRVDRMSQRSQRTSNTDLLRQQMNPPVSGTSAGKSEKQIAASQLMPIETSPIKTKRSHSHTPEASPAKVVQSPQRTIDSNTRLLTQDAASTSRPGPKKSKATATTSANLSRDPRINSQQIKSPAKKHRIIRNNILDDFFVKAGITLSEEQDQYVIETGPFIVAKKMQQLLASGDYSKDEIIEEWNSNLLQNLEHLERSLNSTIIKNCDGKQLGSLNSISLVKILLHVPLVQTEILNNLLQKLNEAVIVANSIQDAPWTYSLMQQLRFLETINDSQLLTVKLEELLETTPIWFQQELISFLPDILIDAQHENIAELLCRLMEMYDGLTKVILDCITNLSLGKESREELRDKMLKILQNGCHISKMPPIVTFCLLDCTTIEACQNVLRVIRELELQPLIGENFKEYYTNQMLIVNTLKMSIPRVKEMANAAALVVSSTENPPRSLDLVILLLLYDGTRKKKADGIFKQHVKTGFYGVKLLNDFYKNYKDVIKNLQPIALPMACNLLKSEDRMFIDFGANWLRHQFVTHHHTELVHKQREIIEKLILLMGNNDQTAKNVLNILCKMTETENERKYLQAHGNHLRILLEKIEKFDLEEVTILNDLLHALCANSNTISDALRDDLTILMQKQLSCIDSTTKCKGVAGAVMAIKHLATNSKCSKTARDIFHNVQNSIKDCPRSQGLFYDKLGCIIAETENINEKFLQSITDLIENTFTDTYITDRSNYKGELVPSFGLDDQEDESQILLIHFGQYKGGAIVPALLRLMRICFMRINKDITAIDALLGCAILMPKDLDMPDAETLDLIFHCVNWYRELINTFVTYPDASSQKKVSKRIANVMQLQGDLSNLLTLAEPRYQPPPCYFHSSRVPQLNKVEKKISKKGKRSANAPERSATLPEWESWEMGTLLSTKNPMYFRRLDAKILHLLDMRINGDESQAKLDDVSTGQVCFIIKEILAVFEDDTANETFVRDLIHLLPKICDKLQTIVNELRSEKDSSQNKQAMRLILCLLTVIFNWKGFNHSTHKTMLRDGLRIVAGQLDQSNTSLGSCKELVGESFKYFESMTDFATQIPVASALVDLCKTLMKHSTTFTQQHKDKQATMAFKFLSFEWPDDRHTGAQYKSAVGCLLKNWMDHEPNPLNAVSSILEWLPDEAAKMEKPQDKLTKLPVINKLNIHHLILKIFNGLIKGIEISLSSATTDQRKLQVWREVAENLQRIVSVSKAVTSRSVLLVYLRFMPSLLKVFLTSGMPILEHNLRYQTDEVTRILKMMQGGTRYLNSVCVHSIEKKDMALAKLVPTAKTILEKLLYSVKGMLVLNNSSTAFWMGNLVNKNLDGQEIFSQSSNSTDDRTVPDITASTDKTSGDEGLSDVLDSDIEDEEGEGDAHSSIADD